MSDTKTLLLKAAAEMRAEDQNGWPVVCDIAAEAISSQEARIAVLEGALRVAAGQLSWASNANPGPTDDKGRELLALWADEANAALHTEGE